MSLPSHRLEYIEIGRGLAALLVVCFHASEIIGLPKYFGQEPLWGVFSFGYAGVDFFFVLSGFIIFYSTAKNHANPALVVSYAKHRLIRIYPIYWVVGFILLPLTYIMGHSVGLVNTVLDFLLVPREGGPFVIVAWTLRHEILFYFSFILFFLNVTFAWCYFLIWGGAIIVCSLLSLEITSPFLSLYFDNHNLEFLFGIFVGQYAKLNQVTVIKSSRLLIIGAAVFLMSGLNDSLVIIETRSKHDHYHLLYGFGATLMVSGLIGMKTDLRSYWIRIGSFLGRASYSIYLIHFAVLSAVIKLLLPLGLALWLDMVFLVLAGILIGSLMYQYVEQPMIYTIRKRLAKDRY